VISENYKKYNEAETFMYKWEADAHPVVIWDHFKEINIIQ